MKNMSRRTKLILAIVGALVIVIIGVGLVMNQMTGGELVGTASSLVITPSNPTVLKGNSVSLSVNATYNCNWFSSNTAAASIVGDGKEVKAVTVQANAAGSAVVEARCGIINVNRVSTVVTVVDPPTLTPTATRTRTPTPTVTPSGLWLSPANLTVNLGQVILYTVHNVRSSNRCLNWSSDKGQFALPPSQATYPTATLYVDSYSGVRGTGYVRVICDGVEIRTSITVQ